MRRTLLVLATLPFVACSGGTQQSSDGSAASDGPSSDAGTGTDAAGPDLAVAPPPFAAACTDSVTDVYTAPSGLPAFDPSHRGDVVRCARDRQLSATQLGTALGADGTLNGPPSMGVTVYRIAYRTSRNHDAAGAKDGLSSALVLLPDTPRSDVYVVMAHGTVGSADKCAPSLNDPTSGNESDATILDYTPAGQGFITIAPDYAGYGYGQNGTSGWYLAEDEAHSLLDATRAMTKLVKASALPTKVAILGHSQGGHAALAAQALAGSYGHDGTLVGVAAFAPVWLAARAWGAARSQAVGLDTKSSAGILSFVLPDWWGHGEIDDGPGGGVAMFQPSKQAQVKTMMTTLCLDDLRKALPSLGTTPYDFFDNTFADDISNCGIGDVCNGAASKTWKPRWAEDRPAFDGAGAPLLVIHGGADKTVTPAFAQCGIDKLAADLAASSTKMATQTVCVDPMADHGGVVRRDINFALAWVLARAGAGAEPPACMAWQPTTCMNPPPNTD